MDASEIIRSLDLKPGTCGYMRKSWENQHGAVLFFLITPERRGEVHRLNADQMYHYYAGAPLEVALLAARGEVSHHTLGPFDIHGGAVAQLLIPGGTIHGSRTTGAFTLACTTSFSDERAVESDPSPDERSIMASQGFA
jgi:predicted cupin superfamily sugar epimerase